MNKTLEYNSTYYYTLESGYWGTVKKRSLEKCLGNIKLNEDTIKIEIKDENKVKEHLDYLYDILNVNPDHRLYKFSPNIDNTKSSFLNWAEEHIPQIAFLYQTGNNNILHLFNELRLYIAILSEFNINNKCIIEIEY